MDEQSRDSIARFVRRCRVEAGSGGKLARVIEPWYGRTHHSTVDAWANGTSNPPGWVLFTLARVFKLSLDEFALSEEDRRALGDQLAELRQDVQALQVQVARLLEQDDLRAEEA